MFPVCQSHSNPQCWVAFPMNSSVGIINNAFYSFNLSNILGYMQNESHQQRVKNLKAKEKRAFHTLSAKKNKDMDTVIFPS